MAAAPTPPRLASAPPRPADDSLKFKSKSIEDQVRLAYHTPAPNKYAPYESSGRRNPKVLGKISDARIPSALDHGRAEKSMMPGPGSYDSRDMALPEGGRLSRKPPQDRMQFDEYPSPAPGTYGVPHDPTVPRQLYGQFSKDPRVSKFIEDEMRRSGEVPAPGAHDVAGSMENVRPFCPDGGRYMEQSSRSSGYFDSAAKLADSKPGPDQYNLPGSIQPNKSAGKLVWKYKSETMDDTSKVVSKVAGTGHDVPAPGTYNVPDPAPLSQAPRLRGRQAGHAMPHPFAYNCAPDLSRKFDSYAPVRNANSAEQIYGNGKARIKDAPDGVAASDMPWILAEKSIEQPGESTRWRSGGFATLHKAKSAPVIDKAEHPAVLDTMKHYQVVSKKNGRRAKAFVPYAHRQPEIVKTSSKSDEYIQLQRKKWELDTLTAELANSSAAALEPLDLELLREQATLGLIDKARFKMRMEGLGKEQQDLVLNEFPSVLSEIPGGRSAQQADGELAY